MHTPSVSIDERDELLPKVRCSDPLRRQILPPMRRKVGEDMRHCGKDMVYIPGGLRCDDCGKTLMFGKGKAEKKEKREEKNDAS